MRIFGVLGFLFILLNFSATNALVCEGNGVDAKIVYSFTTFSSYATFAVYPTGESEFTLVINEPQESITEYEFCATANSYTFETTGLSALPQGSYFTVMLHLRDNIYETVMRVSHDNLYLDHPTVHSFTTSYVIPAGSQWYYKMGTIPSNWNNNNAPSWSQASVGSFPASTNRIQLYKRMIGVFNYDTNDASIILSLRYRYGCIVYINGMEVFRHGVTGALSTSSVATTSYSELKYRQIVIRNHMLTTLNFGALSVSVALISQDATQTSSDFDLAFRFEGTDVNYSRMFDYTISSSSFTSTANALDMHYSTSLSSDSCTDNHIEIQFNEDRHEFMNALDLQYYGDVNPPSQLTIRAKNNEDTEWTLLREVSGIAFTSDRVRIFFVNVKSYNMYRIENIGTGTSENCNWAISHLSFTHVNPHFNTNLKYPAPGILLQNKFFSISPETPYFINYSISPALPEGVSIDPEFGIISGSAASPSTQGYTVTATRADGESKTVTVQIDIYECAAGLVPLKIDLYQTGSFMKIFLGEEEYLTQNNRKTVVHCFPEGIYRIELTGGARDYIGVYYNSLKKAKISIDDFAFDYFAIERGGTFVSRKFSSIIPFHKESTWMISSSYVEGWTAPSFDDSTWTSSVSSGLQMPVAYFRKVLTLPNTIDYHVLNVQVTYVGGVAAYFNDRRVARFNLPETIDQETRPLVTVNNNAVTSTFSVIIDGVESFVIAFEVHSQLSTISFSASGAYGVNDCSILTTSNTGSFSSNMLASSYYRNMFDFDLGISPELDRYFEGNDMNMYITWTTNNLENTDFNAMKVTQYINQFYEGCDIEFSGFDTTTQMFTPVISALNQNFTSFTSKYLLAPEMASYNQFKMTIPHECNVDSSGDVIAFAAVHPVYCVAQTCPADGEYPSVMNGQNSTIRCPEGSEGYLNRLCENGVLSAEVISTCKIVNKMTYGKENVILITANEPVTFAPTLFHPVSSFGISELAELPSGLTFDSSTGTISGQATATTSELVFTITALDENDNVDNNASTSAVVVMLVVESEVFAITKGAVVTAGENTITPSIEGTVYDYYELDHTTTYVILKNEGATVIPFVGDVWKYERPYLYKEEYYFAPTAYTFVEWTPTAKDPFTHYQYYSTQCDTAHTPILIEDHLAHTVTSACAKLDTEIRVSSNHDSIVVRNSHKEVIPVSKRSSISVYYQIPSDSIPDSIEEADELIYHNDNVGILGIGPYYSMSHEEFAEKMLMNSPYSSSSGMISIKPALTFDEKKKSLFKHTLLEGLSEEVTKMKDYVTETALTMMEIVYYIQNGKKIQLSRSQVRQLVAEYCTQDDCTANWRIVIDALQNTGICEEGTEADSSCPRYKMAGFNQEAVSNRNTKWIKEQLDSGRPVFTLLSLDPRQLQYHNAYNKRGINKQAPGVMNFGGVIIGYNAEREGNEYWEVAVRRHGSYNNCIKIMMDVSGKNFARMTNYAFTIANVVN